jgi:hypothetical protein
MEFVERVKIESQSHVDILEQVYQRKRNPNPRSCAWSNSDDDSIIQVDSDRESIAKAYLMFKVAHTLDIEEDEEPIVTSKVKKVTKKAAVKPVGVKAVKPVGVKAIEKVVVKSSWEYKEVDSEEEEVLILKGEGRSNKILRF